MEEQPSFASRVESLPEDHPFRIIFEQVKKNLAYVGISLDGDNNGITVFDVPHRLERYEGNMTVTKESPNTDKAPHIDVVFEMDAISHKVEYVLTLLPDRFKLEYSLEDGDEVQHGTDFSGITVWYKNGRPIEHHSDESPTEPSFLDDMPQVEPDILERLTDIVRQQEAVFREAENTRHVSIAG